MGRRGFGEIEKRLSAGGRVSYRARYGMPDGSRFSRTLQTKMDAEAWLVSERRLIDQDAWRPPKVREDEAAKERAAADLNTVEAFAEQYLAERGLRATTISGYRTLLRTRILPFFGDIPLSSITLTDIKRWRAGLDPATRSTNAAAYRLLRSLLQAAEEEELIDRAPPKIRGASTARVKTVAKSATLDELATIVEAMPERLQLFVVVAAFVGLRSGELLELRRSDVDGTIGQLVVSRKVDKEPFPGAENPCPKCGRGIGPPKTSSGTRTVHLPPPFLPLLQRHLLRHTAPGENGLLFPGDRTDHMSVRYLYGHYRSATVSAGRADLTVHHLRHTALTMAGQHGATAAELQARGGHSSQAAMAIYQHGTAQRDRLLAESIGQTYQAWSAQRTRGAADRRSPM